MTFKNRIDVHQHVVPPFWADSLSAHGGDPSGWTTPEWSPQAAIDFMDAREIATAVLSLTAPGVAGWDGQEKRDIARRVNEYTADLVGTNPARFGNFVTLPLPDIDGVLLEIEHAYGALQADGVVLLSNYNGMYLGDAAFEPMWAELDRRKAVVFIHPAKPGLPSIDGIPGPVIDYPFDTTRTAYQLVLSGVVERYPNTSIILSHAGGFLPFASHRFAELAHALRPDGPTPEQILALYQRFYFDTALSSGPAALPSLKAFAGVDKVLYGSDFPYAPAFVGASFTAKLDAYEGFLKDEHARVNNGNALSLFPRLASPT